MSEPHPCLPAAPASSWEAVPEGLAELRRCLTKEHGASLLLTRDLEAWLDGNPRTARAAALESWQPRILSVSE